MKRVTYHGVFASAAGYRDRVVPQPEEQIAPSPPTSEPEPRLLPARRKRGKQRKRYSWADLLRRVFLIDVLTCDRCGGPRKLLACITEQQIIRKILTHLGLPSDPPSRAAARSPPGRLAGAW